MKISLALALGALLIVGVATIALHQPRGPDMLTVDDVLKIQNVSGGN